MNPAATPEIRVHIAEHVHAREFDGELVILDLEQGQYYSLDEIGTKLWSGMAGGKTPAEVARELESAYDVEPAVLLNDLVALCSEWLAQGLVQPGAP